MKFITRPLLAWHVRVPLVNPSIFIAGLIVPLLFSLPAHGSSWVMVEAGSALKFRSNYEGQPLTGTFDHFDTRLLLNRNNPQNNKLRVVVDINSLNLGSSDLQEGAASPEWFNTAGYPQAIFDSERVEQTGPNTYRAEGKLKLKGIDKTLVVPFTLDTSLPNPVIRGELEVQRTDFNIGSGEWSVDTTIGLAVTVTFTVRLQNAK